MTDVPDGLPEDFWESRFKDSRTPWERGEMNPAFTAWRASGALAPCRILVPGAGRSPEPAAMLAQGFDVQAIDLADSAVAFQSHAIGAARVAQADVTTWMPDAPFDVIYDQTCLCALPPSLWAAYEAQLRRWLRPGGRLFVLFMQTGRTGGPPFDCPVADMRRLFGAWQWPEDLGAGLPHGLGTIEQPAVLRLGGDAATGTAGARAC